MGILFSAFASTGRRREIKLPDVSALHLELLSLYSSTVTEVLALLAPLSFDARLAALTERTLKRSELTSDAEIAKFFQQDGNRPSRLPHLIFVCHKIQGQRTPLVDGKGLYSKFLDAGINLCEIVFFLLDVPSVAYLHRLLSEQPTLNWLFKRKRLIPIFIDSAKGENRYWEALILDAVTGKLPGLGMFRSEPVEFSSSTKLDELVDTFLAPPVPLEN